MSCNCNQITCACCGTQSTLEVCGDFPVPENPDQGQCFPYREKRSCEAPTRPGNPCDDVGAYAIVDPNSPSRFIIIATVFDENCLPIQDETVASIMAQFQTD